MTLREGLIRLQGGTPRDAQEHAGPTAPIGEAFRRMLDDLRGSTERLEAWASS